MIQLTKLVRYFKAQMPHFKGVEIANEANVEIKVGVDQVGPGTIIGPRAWISSKNGGTLRIGKRCEVGVGTLILTYGGDITIGDDCSFNPYCVIYGHGGLTIGNFVRIATHTVIIPANHRYDRRDVPIHQQGLTMKGVTIEDNVWVGAGVVILDGVSIGTGSVVAAGAVVSQDVESYSVVAGVPARRIK